MTTLYLDWNSDLIIAPNGSVLMATGWDEIRQRIIRRAVTNPAEVLPDGRFTPADYIFHVTYGEGIASLVDQNPNANFWPDFKSKINSACLQDVAVSPGAQPNISFVQPTSYIMQINIVVTLANGKQGKLAVAVKTGTVTP